jgi:hypothetical protein
MAIDTAVIDLLRKQYELVTRPDPSVGDMSRCLKETYQLLLYDESKNTDAKILKEINDIKEDTLNRYADSLIVTKQTLMQLANRRGKDYQHPFKLPNNYLNCNLGAQIKNGRTVISPHNPSILDNYLFHHVIGFCSASRELDISHYFKTDDTGLDHTDKTSLQFEGLRMIVKGVAFTERQYNLMHRAP